MTAACRMAGASLFTGDGGNGNRKCLQKFELFVI